MPTLAAAIVANGSVPNFDGFMDEIRPIYDAVIGDRLGSKPFDSIGTMLRFLPRMAQLKAFLPVTTFVNRWFKDFRHRFIYSFHPLFVGGNPFKTPSIYLMIPFLEREGGVWFSKGGMYSVVEALGRLFAEQGGQLRTGQEVNEILIEDGRLSASLISSSLISKALPVAFISSSSLRALLPRWMACSLTVAAFFSRTMLR